MVKLPSYAEILKKGKVLINASLAPIRAAQIKKQAELEKMKIEEKILTKETEVQGLCTEYPVDFDKVISKIDEIALLERRKKQFDKIIADMFPDEKSED